MARPKVSPRKKITFSLPSPIYDQVQRLAAEGLRTTPDYVRALVLSHLHRQPEPTTAPTA